MAVPSEPIQIDYDHSYQGIFWMEEVSMGEVVSEKNMWNSVLLQLLKEAGATKKCVETTSKDTNNEDLSSEIRQQAFNKNVLARRKRRYIKFYIFTNDFQTVCDFAGHEYKTVRSKILDVLDGKCELSMNQVKRNFRRN